MKRRLLLGCLLLACLLPLLLAGCGEVQEQEDTAQAVWGSVAEEPVLASSTYAPSSVPTSTPTSTPTPTPPASLSSIAEAGPTLVVEGKTLTTVQVDGTYLVKYDDLHAAFPWFTWRSGHEEALFTGKSGECIPISFCTVDDTQTGRYTGTGGILYAGTEYWLPVVELAKAMGARLVWDAENNTGYLGAPVNKSLISQKVTVPVLMYHAVSDDVWGIGSLFVSPENMREQIEYLLENGYDPIFFSDLTHLSDYDKPILLTFDDGYDDNYDNLFPLLQEFGVKATIFVVTGMLGDEHYLTRDEVREMSDSGLCEMESHTVNHYELATLSAADQEYQLSQSQLELARITGKVPYVLSYPSGSHNQTTIDLAEKYYDFAVKMNGNDWTIDGAYYEIRRVYISRFDGMETFQQKVSLNE